MPIALIIFVFGLIIGSFLNVCIYRIPKKQSLLYPPSSCPGCGRRLAFFDLVPVLSYLILKGRCRGCHSKISFRYPLVELLTGILFLVAYLQFGLSLMLLKALILISLLEVISFIDLDLQIIPNALTIPGMVVGIAVSYTTWLDAVIGFFAGFMIIAAVILLSKWLMGKEGMGWGDAKLLAMIGAFLGWRSVFYTLFIGSLLGSFIGLTLILIKKMDRKTPMAFGPFLCFASLIILLYPDILKEVTRFYLGLFQ